MVETRQCDERIQTYVLRAQASPVASRRLSKAVVCILSDAVMDKDLLYNLDLVLSEACANVVRHAYAEKPFHPEQQLEITLTLREGEQLEIEVADWGRGFPVWPMDIKNASPEAEGGRGLFIMSELVDHFELRQQDGRNSVFMTLRVKERQWNLSA